MSAYSRRFQSSSSASKRPECFGDADIRDPRDPDCAACRFKHTCRVAIARKQRREDHDGGPRYYSAGSSKKKKKKKNSNRVHRSHAPDPEDLLEREDSSLSFFGALAVNGVLSGIRAGLVEATFAVDQIPRYPYPDPFEAAVKRGRASVLGDDDDDHYDDDEDEDEDE